MWPLSSRRSRTFSTSKLGYLASRAPRAMFSRSRKTAMVASDVLAVIQLCSSLSLEFTPFHSARLRRLVPRHGDVERLTVFSPRHTTPPRAPNLLLMGRRSTSPCRSLEPIVIEADAETLRIGAVRHHFMPQPTFEKHQLTGRDGKCSPRTALAFCGGFARRRSHEAIQARILEFDSGGSTRDVYIVGAAQRRQRMQMQAMHHMPRHDVDPAIGHLQFAPVKIPLDGLGEGGDMPCKFALQ